MTTPNDTPRTDEVNDANYYGSLVGSAKIDMLVNFARHLERELAEAKAESAKFQKAEKEVSDAYLRLRKMLNAFNTNYGGEDRFAVTEKCLFDVMQDRDAHARENIKHRDEAAKWRELAKYLWAGDDQSMEMLAGICQTNNPCPLCHAPSPPQSSPSPEPSYSVPSPAELPQRMKSGLPRADTVQEPPVAAPAEATASRLQALESGQDILLRRTEFLLGLCSVLRARVGWETSLDVWFKIAWPADLALPTLTSTSPPTQKPERSDDASCG